VSGPAWGIKLYIEGLLVSGDGTNSGKGGHKSMANTYALMNGAFSRRAAV
jgi:hypothetical protein